MGDETITLNVSPAETTDLDNDNDPNEIDQGDTAEWVLTYENNTDDPIANAQINNDLSAGQEYVVGSAHAPNGWNVEFSTNGGTSYSTTEPASGVTDIRFVNPLAPADATGTLSVIPEPLAPVNQGTDGDGFIPILAGNRIYAIFHHSNHTFTCIDRTTNAICPGYPKQVTQTVSDGVRIFQAANSPGGGVAFGDRFYTIGYRRGDQTTPAPFGLICWDGTTDDMCADGDFIEMVPHLPIGPNDSPRAGGPQAIGDKIYVITDNHQIHCLDVNTNALCTGYPKNTALIGATGVTPSTSVNETAGQIDMETDVATGRIYGVYKEHLHCFDTNTDAPCADWASNVSFNNGTYNTGGDRNFGLFFRTDATGVRNGICTRFSNGGTTSTPTCYDLDGTNPVVQPAAFNCGSGDRNYCGLWQIYTDTSVGTRVIFSSSHRPDGSSGGSAFCWDWATNAPCQGPGYDANGKVDHYVNQGNTNTGEYGAVTEGSCVFNLGHAGLLHTFDAITGTAPCAAVDPTTLSTLSVSPADFACGSDTISFTWDELKVFDTDLTAGVHFDVFNVTILDGNNNPILGPVDMVDGTGTLDLSGISNSVTTIKALVNPVTVDGNPAWSNGRSPKLTMSFDGPPIEFCFETTPPTGCPVQTTISDTATTSFSSAAVSDSLSVYPAQACVLDGTITIIKDTVPNDGQDFNFTTTGGLSLASFILDDDADPTRANNISFNNVEPGSYTVTEAATSGYSTSISCLDPDGGTTTSSATATIDLDAGETVTCTFTNIQQVVDLSLTKSDGGITAVPGDTVVYTINYENTQGGGTVDTATNVILTETVPPNTTFNATASGGVWSCADGSPGGTTCTQTIGSVAPSASGSTTFAVDVDNPFSATGGIQIQNTATISSDQSDRAPGNNTVIEQTPITAAPELAITKSDGGGSFEAGDTIVYTVGVTNTGNRIAPSVIISETVPTHTTFNPGASSTGWTCSPMGGPAGANCTLQIPLLDNTPQTILFAVNVDGMLSPTVTSTDNHIDIRSSSQFPESNTDNNEFQLTTQLDNAGSITIIKDVTYVADIDLDSGRDFPFFSTELGDFFLDDPLIDDTDGITEEIVFLDQVPGSYTISEGPNGNWIQSVLCVGDDNISYIAPGTGATIDLDAGEDVVCTFTNERVTYDLTYTKVLTPGTPVPDDDWEFTLASLFNLVPGDINIDFGVVTTATASGGSSTLTLPLAAYKVGEVVPLNYDLVQINCGPGGLSTSPPVNDQFTIILDQNLTCVFTNETTKAEITLIKNVVNDNGGTAGVNDFGLTIGGTAVNSGDTLLVNANVPVAINETLVADYDFVSITGHAKCPAMLGGSITPAPGEKITCTITNDDQPGILVITKQTVPLDPQDFSFSVTGGLIPANFQLDDDGNDDTTLANDIVFMDVISGTYEVTETPVPGFEIFINCLDESGDTTISGNKATAKVGLGETVICKFTNEKQIPEISIDDVLIVEGTGGNTTMEFTVVRTNNYFTTSVTANSVDGTADSPVDFGSVVNEVINFAPGGALSKVISVDITTDAIVEADETLFVNLSNPVNGTIIDSQGQGTIINDDKTVLKLSGGTSRTETDSGQVEYIFYAILSEGVQGGFSIDIANLDLTATVTDNDYEANSDTLTFVGNPNERHTFTILVNGDKKVEADEKFAAQFTSDPDTPLKDDIMITTEAGRFDLDHHTATIYNDDKATLKLSGGTSVHEGDNGQKAYVFTATLFDAVQGGFDIDYASRSKTATLTDNDYDAVSGTLSFAGNANEAHTITIFVNGDTKVEADEIFLAAFTSAPKTILADYIEITGAPGKLQRYHEATIFNDDEAIVSLSGPVEHAEGDSGTTSYTFKATLNADVDGGFDIAYAVEDGTAKAADGDYVAQNGTLNFSGTKGEEHTITVITNGDTIGEAHEVFYVALGDVQTDKPGITIGTANNPQVGTITNDDAAVLFLDVNLSNNSVSEDGTTLPVQVMLSNEVDRETSVDYTVSSNSATAGADFEAASGTLTFAAGETSQTINVTILNDNIAEAVEALQVTLSNPSGIGLSSESSAELLILDDEAAPTVSLAPATISEADGTAEVELTLSHPSAAPVTVRVTSANGTAIAGSDYEKVDQTVTFAPGETSQAAVITLVSDDSYERDESLNLTISDVTNGQLPAETEAEITIEEDDAAPVVSVSDVSVTEPESGSQMMTFELSLEKPVAVDISIDFETADGTAIADEDYTFTHGTLVIKAGSMGGSIDVVILSDADDEGAETLTLLLSNLSDGVLAGSAAAGSVTGEITSPTVEPPSNEPFMIFLPLISR